MIIEAIKNKVQEWKDRRYLKGLTRVELIGDVEKFKNALLKTAEAIQRLNGYSCPRCDAHSNSDFSFCPTCACPKKSRLVKIKENDEL